MFKLLFTIIIFAFSQIALADCNNASCPSSCSNHSDMVVDPSKTANCSIGNDPSCLTGYCGYFDDKSPINIPNMFGVLLNDFIDFGTPTIFLDLLETIDLGTCNTEGAFVQLNCQGSPDSNGNYDWVNCPTTCTNVLSYNSDYSCASPNLAKPAVSGNGTLLTGARGQQLYCPLMRANISTSDLWFNLSYNTMFEGTKTDNHKKSVNDGVFSPGLCQADAFWLCPLDLTQLEIVQDGDQICMQGLFPGFSQIFGNWLTISCKYSIAPTSFPTPKTACYVASSCAGDQLSSMHTLSRFTFLGNFIECFTDTLNGLFINPPTGCPQTALLYNFQVQMRQVVSVVLTLYIIFIGIRIAASGEVPKKTEFFMFILKFALVLYFAVGTFGGDVSTSNIYNNGLQFAYQSAFAFMNEFANNIMKASGAAENGFCLFPPGGVQYPVINNVDYSYLALWDSLDCHISAYLGIYDLIQGYSKITTVLSAIFIYMLGFNPVMTLFLLAFAFFMISVMIYVANIFVLCMLGMTFVVYLGPIFIPLSLFTFTKQYFDNWFKMLMSYILQPAVVIAGLALIIVTLDNQMYKGCTFTMEGPTTTGYYYAVFDNPNDQCKSSFGYFVSQLQQSDLGGLMHIGFYTFYQPSLPSLSFMGNLMTIALLLFIFQSFVMMLGALAADVTGGMNMSDSVMATPKDLQNLMSKAFTATKAITRKALTAGASAAFGSKKSARTTPPTGPNEGGQGGSPAVSAPADSEAASNSAQPPSDSTRSGAADGVSVTSTAPTGSESQSSLGFNADLRSSSSASQAPVIQDAASAVESARTAAGVLPNAASAVDSARATAATLPNATSAIAATTPSTNNVDSSTSRSGAESATSPDRAAESPAPDMRDSGRVDPKPSSRDESAIDKLHRTISKPGDSVDE